MSDLSGLATPQAAEASGIPIGLAIGVLVATPVLAFVGTLVGHVWSRKGAAELDKWRHREETMRTVRWAAEKAMESHEFTREVGLAALQALADSELLQIEDKTFVDKVTDAVLAPRVREVESGLRQSTEYLEDVDVFVDTGEEEANDG